MPGHYGDKEKTKSKTVTKTKNGKTVTKSKTKTKVKGKKKAEKGSAGNQIGKMLAGFASTAKKKDPYDSSTKRRDLSAQEEKIIHLGGKEMQQQIHLGGKEMQQQLKRKSIKVK